MSTHTHALEGVAEGGGEPVDGLGPRLAEVEQVARGEDAHLCLWCCGKSGGVVGCRGRGEEAWGGGVIDRGKRGVGCQGRVF